MTPLPVRNVFALVACAALIALSPWAQGAPLQRTFVKSNGVDNPTCNLAAPCRTFAAAFANVLAGGEVIVLDSAGYGAVTITQSVSIIAPPGVYAGIAVNAGNGITIGTAGIVVVLQGLTINGFGTGTHGIAVTADAEVHVINCSIANMASSGIDVTATAGSLYVSDTTIRDNTGLGRGAFLSGPVKAVFDRVRIERNGSSGIHALSGALVSVRDSVIGTNAGFGVFVNASGGATTRGTVQDSLLADNSGSGADAYAQDAGSLATLDVLLATSTRSGSGDGATSFANAPGVAVLTVADSMLTENSGYGVFATNNAVALANRNTIARNGSGGLASFGGGVLHTRSNNAGEQSSPTFGTTPVGGF